MKFIYFAFLVILVAGFALAGLEERLQKITGLLPNLKNALRDAINAGQGGINGRGYVGHGTVGYHVG